MFKYIKKFYTYLSGDSTENSKKQVDVQTPSPSPDRKSVNEDVKARVSYQYPKGNFRFPLISDDEVEKKTPRRPQGRVEQQKPKNKAPVHIEKKKITKSPSSHPFKATKVPSPVYGFKERKRNTGDQELQPDPIEFELHSKSSTPEVVLDRLVHQRPETSFEEYVETPTNTIYETSIVEEYNNHPSDLGNEEPVNNYLEDDISYEEVDFESDHEESHEEVFIDQELKENTNAGESSQSSHIETVNEYVEPRNEVLVETVPPAVTEPQKSEQTEEKRSRNHVPFNVMMLRQDRQKIEKKQENPVREPGYTFPPLHYLTIPKQDVHTDDNWLDEQRQLLDVTLENFNVKAKVVNVTQGPSVTRFEVHPEPGVKVNKITNLSDDIKLSLSARDIRMEAPIPGKNTIGIEVPNKISKPVFLSEIIRSQAFRNDASPLTVALGLDISGKPIVTDLKKMPHGLIAGATGSGKSVCINAMLISLLYKASPDQVKLLLIDPKMVELAPYNDIPHLVSPVITDVKAATAALKWAVEEMERRYERFAHSGVRDINRYNELVREHNEPSGEMPFLVIIIDELADLMMVAPGEVEESICRIAQKARACGIHLLLATQRPSVDVITGLIKANVPTRIAFSVSSQVDSRTIVDTSGAEKLLGKGDMLFLENGSSKSVRLQGNFVSDQEIERIVSHVKEQQKPEYLFQQQELIAKSSITQDEDELFYEACEFVIEQGGASSSLLQRRFRIGYNRAARLIEMMAENGIVSEQKGSKPRDVLISEDELLEVYEAKSVTT
jgi:S-DNA-T family DNA segregation ATPase FtsK/SpoIIIE